MLTPALAEQGYYGEALERPEARGIYHDAAAEKALFGAEGLTFDSLLDAINPLHHIPVVGSIYTELTGDKIATGPSVVGGLLFGGVIGAAGSVANAAFEAVTGDSIGGHVMAMIDDEDEAPPGDVTVGQVQLAGAAQDGAADKAPATAQAASATSAGDQASVAAALAAAQPAIRPATADAGRQPAVAAASQTAAANAAALDAGAMFRAKNAHPASGADAPAAPPQAAGPSQTVAPAQVASLDPALAGAGRAPAAPNDMPSADPGGNPGAAALSRIANAQATDMPALPPDLDARLRHAQKAMAASGLIASPDAAMRARIGQALNQATPAEAGAQVPPPPSVADAGRPPAQAQGQTQPLSQGQVQAQVQQAAVTAPARPGSHTYMPLDGESRGGRRWYGLGTADVVASPVPASPQMAAQALANEVYRQRGAAAQAAAPSLDVSY